MAHLRPLAALAAIQALYRLLQEKDEQLQQQSQIDDLRRQLEALRATLQAD